MGWNTTADRKPHRFISCLKKRSQGIKSYFRLNRSGIGPWFCHCLQAGLNSMDRSVKGQAGPCPVGRNQCSLTLVFLSKKKSKRHCPRATPLLVTSAIRYTSWLYLPCLRIRDYLMLYSAHKNRASASGKKSKMAWGITQLFQQLLGKKNIKEG